MGLDFKIGSPPPNTPPFFFDDVADLRDKAFVLYHASSHAALLVSSSARN